MTIDRPSSLSDPWAPDVWVVIAALNEASTIESVVRELVSHGYDVVVTDDGSRDETGRVARRAGAVVLRHVVNLGQGASLQTGIDFAISRGAEVVVTFDADGQHSPEDIPTLLGALESGADVALGSRFLGRAVGAPTGRLLLLRAAARMSGWITGVRLTDVHCGLRAFRPDVAPKLRLNQPRMAHASEFITNVRRHGLVVREVPVTIRYTDYSRSKGQRSIQAFQIVFDLLFRQV